MNAQERKIIENVVAKLEGRDGGTSREILEMLATSSPGACMRQWLDTYVSGALRLILAGDFETATSLSRVQQPQEPMASVYPAEREAAIRADIEKRYEPLMRAVAGLTVGDMRDNPRARAVGDAFKQL